MLEVRTLKIEYILTLWGLENIVLGTRCCKQKKCKDRICSIWIFFTIHFLIPLLVLQVLCLSSIKYCVAFEPVSKLSHFLVT